MKRNYKFIIPIILLAGILLSFKFKYQPDPIKDQQLVKVLRYVLTHGHFQPADINDEFSEGVYTSFLEILDPTKHYFLQTDIDEFSQYKHQIDDQVLTDSLTFFYTVYDRYLQRVKESEGYYTELLNNSFDTNKEETYSVDYENTPYPKTKEELITIWHKQLKMRYLGHLYNKELVESDNVEEDSTYIKKSIEVLKEEALEKTKAN